VVQNGIQSRCNVRTNTATNINATDNTVTKTAASESSKPKGRQRIGATRYHRKKRISNARYVQGDHQRVHEATWPPPAVKIKQALRFLQFTFKQCVIIQT
jgi:hypothetical protein